MCVYCENICRTTPYHWKRLKKTSTMFLGWQLLLLLDYSEMKFTFSLWRAYKINLKCDLLSLSLSLARVFFKKRKCKCSFFVVVCGRRQFGKKKRERETDHLNCYSSPVLIHTKKRERHFGKSMRLAYQLMQR